MSTKLLLDIISKGCTMDTVMYNICFNIICHENKSSDSLSLMMNMIETGFKPNNVTYNTILKGLCKEIIEAALELFDCLEWDRNGPDLVSFNTVLSAAYHQGNSPIVQKILARMEYEGVNVNAVISTCLIQYFDTVGKIPECLKLLEAMMLNGPFPTIVNFNTLMRILCKNRLLGMAHRVFKCLKSTRLLPDLITYNILIRASIREGNDQLLSQLLRDMYIQGLKQDAVTFGSLIYGLCKEGNITVARKLWEQMTGNGITPNIAIYNTIMEAMFHTVKFRDIIMLLKEMAMEGRKPNGVSFEILNGAMSNSWMNEIPRSKTFERVHIMDR
ncbi:hypothetical protein RHMOL_Rhmol02G0235100 [Rhododendron molle]|uniref:Uncharacterized protein n=1 Tax=Rhododendron molle TaxID=49168 RepID=A0ACC0PWF7_RHOML|nr:hypothetical protein RHMOL_Rhmol02G0235100 [Rhododendron molle]